MGELYRQSKLGQALADALDEMVHNEQLQPSVALKALEHFDSTMQDALARCNVHASLSGYLFSFRRVSGVLTLNATDLRVRLQAKGHSDVVVCPSARLLAVDAPDAAESTARKRKR